MTEAPCTVPGCDLPGEFRVDLGATRLARFAHLSRPALARRELVCVSHVGQTVQAFVDEHDLRDEARDAIEVYIP